MFRGFLEHKVRKLSLRGDVSRMGLYENYVKNFLKMADLRNIVREKRYLRSGKRNDGAIHDRLSFPQDK